MEFGFRRLGKAFAMLALALAVSLTAVDFAEARRGGGGFGSRGSRTFSAPPVTRTAPAPASGIDRSMTPRTQAPAAQQNAARSGNAAQPQRRGFFGGIAGGLMGGLLLGGLFGMLMGHGFGGFAGFLGLLLQVALIAGLAFLAMRLFARRQQPAGNASGNGRPGPHAYQATGQAHGQASGQQGASFPGADIGRRGAAVPRQASPQTDEIGISNRDLDQFETLLRNVQSAYADEDYARLRGLTTPEAMSYLAEELSENATSGVRNVVRDVTLLQGDLAEAWRENGQDYATVAMRYSSIDYLADRNSGAVVEGDAVNASETVEVWTFTRRPAGEWQLSAIQPVG